jgi:pimeloyl-ACP methyl ester carboxylesterase
VSPLPTGGGDTRVLTGISHHAGYVIEVPPNWNGELVMWAHGFHGNVPELSVELPSYGLREKWVGQGYAWAASSYDRNGYDVASGVESTRALVGDVVKQVGRPSKVYLTGVSMGGQIVGRAIEQDPRLYAGALPMCGALNDHDLFDYFLDTTLVAQALAGKAGSYPPGPDYASVVLPQIYAGLGLEPGNPAVPTPQAQQLAAATVLDSGGPRPSAEVSFSFWKDFLLTIAVPGTAPSPVTGVAANPGLVATNIGTDYAPDQPVDLDAVVQRVRAADPRARTTPRLNEVAQVFGRPQVPVLTLHGIGDLYGPLREEQVYAREVAANGRSALLVQRAIRTTGHCEFSPVEAGAAWDDLVAWTKGGPKPAGDVVTDPAAVADPTFGCRFSDRAAFDNAGAPSANDTRRLYEPCPAT